MAPLMIGLACCAKNIVSLVLTDKWLPCVFFLQIFCITYLFWPIHTANLNAINAMGRSDLFLKLEIWKKIVGMVLLLSTMLLSVKAMAYSLLISTLTSMIINSWPNKKLLNYSFIEQIKDILPAIGIALFMGWIVSFVELLPLSLVLKLILQILAGAVIYIGFSAILKLESFEYLWNITKNYFKNKAL